LKNGYRHIDTAAIYGNEEDVGQAIRDSGIPREEIFVTTKLWNADHGSKKVMAACERSLQKLGLKYMDLYLVHSPGQVQTRSETWRAMEEVKKAGLTRSIGVSNYGAAHIESLIKECTEKPVINQLEINPYIQRGDLCKLCLDNGIIPEAYSPLTKGEKLKDPKLVKIAEALGVTPAQVMIRWCLQKGYVVIPKSVTEKRIIENADVFGFTIPDDVMESIVEFDEYLVTGWDPTVSP